MKLILLSVHDEPTVREAAKIAGADAFVLKRSIAKDLLPAIDAVRAGQWYVSPNAATGRHPRTNYMSSYPKAANQVKCVRANSFLLLPRTD
jgi:DNA-binding NarL/FixJ family response regulator